MKYLKMLGLAVVAAMALMSVVGVGSAAAAAKLCSTSGTGASCGAGHGNELTANDTIHATLEAGTKAQLTSTFDNVSCTESTVHGHVTANTPPTGVIDAMTFGTCSDSFGHTCTASTTAATTNWVWHIAWTEGTNGTLTVTNVKGQFVCPNPFNPSENVTCIYGTTAANTAATGSDSTATVKATSVALTKEAGSGGLCSASGSWSGSYLVTSPDDLNITGP